MIYLEGTDGVGKTITKKELEKRDIKCQDRNKEIISKNMLFNVTMEERVKIYEKYLQESNDVVIFLINNDGDELMRRILSRKVISDFDLDTVKYNKLYLDTYNYMKEHNMLHNKLFLVDCTNLTLNEQVEAIIEVLNA